MFQSHPARRTSEVSEADNNSDIKQEEDGNASDDDHMVICEDAQAEIDLKCKDKLTDSDNETQDDNPEKKARCSSPGKREGAKPDVTCRPRAIKGTFRTE